MMAIRYIKSDPSTFLIQYQNGEIRRKGVGLSFFYYAPATSLVAVTRSGASVSPPSP